MVRLEDVHPHYNVPFYSPSSRSLFHDNYLQVAFTHYGDKSRRQRRLMVKALGPSAIPTYHPLLEIETQALLNRLVDKPTEYEAHIRRYVVRHPGRCSRKTATDDFVFALSRYAGTLTLSVVYGYSVTSNDDPLINLAEECVDILSNHIASGGGIWAVDVFPFREPWSLLSVA